LIEPERREAAPFGKGKVGEKEEAVTSRGPPPSFPPTGGLIRAMMEGN
jgi:hypothetical protein